MFIAWLLFFFLCGSVGAQLLFCWVQQFASGFRS